MTSLDMKKGYWIIGVFAIWCFVSAVWYMFSIKGLPEKVGAIAPMAGTIAIIEILLMLTVAFFMGFGLAWMMRQEPLENASELAKNAGYEIRELQSQLAQAHESQHEWKQARQLAEDKAVAEKLHADQLSTKLAELEFSEAAAKATASDLERKLKQLEGELSSAKFRVRVLEGELDDKNKNIGQLTEEINHTAAKPKAEHRDWSDHPFVRPVEADSDDRDDLTEIKGIGPAFQRKLNALDIFTFRQISELDGEAVERLAEVIEVFPERIHRDNWIGQATRLFLRKIGKEA